MEQANDSDDDEYKSDSDEKEDEFDSRKLFARVYPVSEDELPDDLDDMPDLEGIDPEIMEAYDTFSAKYFAKGVVLKKEHIDMIYSVIDPESNDDNTFISLCSDEQQRLMKIKLTTNQPLSYEDRNKLFLHFGHDLIIDIRVSQWTWH